MLLLKLLSLIILTGIAVGLMRLTGHFLGEWNVDAWVFSILQSLIAASAPLCHPYVVRNLARFTSVDLAKWEETRNELTVVRVGIFLFLLMWVVYLFLFSPWYIHILAEPSLFVVLGIIAVFLLAYLPRKYGAEVADLLGISYPNATRDDED